MRRDIDDDPLSCAAFGADKAIDLRRDIVDDPLSCATLGAGKVIEFSKKL